MSIDSERKLSDLLCEHVGLVNNYLLSLPSSEVNFFEGFHLSGWYNLASLRNIVLTSLTVEVELISKTLKGLSENKEHGERERSRVRQEKKKKEEEEEVIEGEENF